MHVALGVNKRESKRPEAMFPPRNDGVVRPPEDRDRKPGGFPHPMMAVTAGLAIGSAGLLLLALSDRSVAAAVLCVLLIPIVIVLMKRESGRERDSIHPSR